MSETVVEAFTACNYPSRLAYDMHWQKYMSSWLFDNCICDCRLLFSW